jgi:hypothetical protein
MEIAPTAPVQDAPTEEIKPDVVPPVEPPKEKDQFSERLELLARKERMIAREKMRMAQEKKEQDEKYAKYESWEQKKKAAKQKPFEYLAEADLSYDELTQYVLNGGEPQKESEVESLRSELAAFKKMQEEKELSQQEKQTQAQALQQQQVIDGFKEEIGEFITANKETYELIAQRDATEEIFSSINDVFMTSVKEWRENGQHGAMPKPMSIKDAADALEEFYEQEIQKLTSTNKWKNKYGQQVQKEDPAKKGPSPTLTNQMTTSSAASVLPAKTEQDRIRRALEKLGQ